MDDVWSVPSRSGSTSRPENIGEPINAACWAHPRGPSSPSTRCHRCSPNPCAITAPCQIHTRRSPVLDVSHKPRCRPWSVSAVASLMPPPLLEGLGPRPRTTADGASWSAQALPTEHGGLCASTTAYERERMEVWRVWGTGVKGPAMACLIEL